jgi:hypothetical protein
MNAMRTLALTRRHGMGQMSEQSQSATIYPSFRGWEQMTEVLTGEQRW